MKEELKFAALYGPEIIPYYRRKIRSRAREMTHSDIEYLLKRVKHEEILVDESLPHHDKCGFICNKMARNLIEVQKSLAVPIDCFIMSPELFYRTTLLNGSYGSRKEVYKLRFDFELRPDEEHPTVDRHLLKVYIDTLMPKNLLLITDKSLCRGVAMKFIN